MVNDNETFENRKDGRVIKFYHNQNVDIIDGFYRNNTGIVTGYIIKDDNKIYYHIDIRDLNIVLLIWENDLREQKRDTSWIKRIFDRRR